MLSDKFLVYKKSPLHICKGLLHWHKAPTYKPKPYLIPFNGNYLIYNGKPTACNSKLLICNGNPTACNGKPVICSGKPIIYNGNLLSCNGKPLPYNGNFVKNDYICTTKFNHHDKKSKTWQAYTA